MEQLKLKIRAFIELFVLASLVVLFLWWTYPHQLAIDSEAGLIPFGAGTTTLGIVSFPETEVEAVSAYVYDAHDGKALFAKNQNEIRPLASLTKLMTALTASTLIPDYVLVRVTLDDIREEGDNGLYVDEQWNARKLIDFSLLTSSNDAVRAIARAGGSMISSTSTEPLALFVSRMNTLAQEIGLRSMHFINQSGLDVSETLSGGYGSAKDVAFLINHILKIDRHLLEATAFSKTTIASDTTVHVVENTDKSIPSIPNVIGSKTGYTDLSGGNVIIAFNAGLSHQIIIVVLGSSYEGRFTDLEKLASSTIAYISKKAQ